jgi:hypothetical protein
MFEQTKAFRIRFQLPEEQRGKIREIRTIAFDAAGIHTFEGTFEEFQTRARYLKNFGALPLELPDMTIAPTRPLPTGVGTHKVANPTRTSDDLDDLSEFKVKPNVAPVSPAPQGDRQPAPDNGSGAKAATDLLERSAANGPDGPASRPSSTGPSLRTQDQVKPEDDADFNF